MSRTAAKSTGTIMRLDYLLAALFLAVMAIIAFANIVARCFHCSFSFTEEITVNLFVWMTVVGSAIAFERGAHLGMVSVNNLFSGAVRKCVIFAGAALAAFLFVVVDILLIRTIYFEMTIFKAPSPSLGIPMWIYYVGVPLLSVFVFRGIWRGAMAVVKELDSEVTNIDNHTEDIP